MTRARVAKVTAVVVLLAVFPAALFAQNRRGKAKPRPAATPQAPATQAPAPKPSPTPAKRNERPGSGDGAAAKPTAAAEPNFFYEFARPGFTYSPIKIEHDEAGRGLISFEKNGYDEPITDPITLSAVTLGRINDTLAALNFVNSSEDYQYSRDYSHLGNVTITVKREGRSRTAEFNWTENKHARALMDEYRRISNEYIWRFEITSARENQPLLAPQLMQQMDDYLRRGEISDPPQLVPFLLALSNDERIPLIARDHAAKLAGQIQKKGSKP